MRLIDVDLLLSAMDSRYNEKKDIVPNNLAEGFMQMEKLIKEQPTAYDVDKVVEEIESVKASAVDEVKLPNFIKKDIKELTDMCFDEAVRIVRGGENEIDRCR